MHTAKYLDSFLWFDKKINVSKVIINKEYALVDIDIILVFQNYLSIFVKIGTPAEKHEELGKPKF